MHLKPTARMFAVICFLCQFGWCLYSFYNTKVYSVDFTHYYICGPWIGSITYTSWLSVIPNAASLLLYFVAQKLNKNWPQRYYLFGVNAIVQYCYMFWLSLCCYILFAGFVACKYYYTIDIFVAFFIPMIFVFVTNIWKFILFCHMSVIILRKFAFDANLPTYTLESIRADAATSGILVSALKPTESPHLESFFDDD
jgi:hypothetical protein